MNYGAVWYVSNLVRSVVVVILCSNVCSRDFFEYFLLPVLHFPSFPWFMKENVVVDEVGVELAEDGPVVGDESNKSSGNLSKFLLTECQSWWDL